MTKKLSKAVQEHEATRVKAWPFHYALRALYEARNAQHRIVRDYEAVLSVSGSLAEQFREALAEADKLERNYKDTIAVFLRDYAEATGEELKLGDWQA